MPPKKPKATVVADSSLPAYVAKAGANEPMARLWLTLQDANATLDSILAAILSPNCGLERKYLERSMDPNSSELASCTPIMLAAKVNRLDVVKSLLKDNKKVNLKQSTLHLRSSVFDFAIESQNLEMLTILVNYDPKALGSFGSAPYLRALRSDNSAAFDLLESKFGLPPSIVADAVAVSMLDSKHVVAVLLDKGCDPNSPRTSNDRPGSPLSIAISRCLVDIALLLLNKGADTSEVIIGTKEGMLHLACKKSGLVEVVKALVAKGVQLNSLDGAGYTPLHYAKDSGDEELISFLKAEGSTGKAEQKALPPPKLASKRSRASTSSAHPQAEALLAKDPDHPMKALWAALIDSSCGPEVAMAIVADMDAGLKQRSTAEDGRMVFTSDIPSNESVPAEILYRRKLSVIVGGATPIMLAAHAGRVDVVTAMYNGGAAVNEETSNKIVNFYEEAPDFALHAAVLNDDVRMIEALLSMGADPLKTCPGSGNTNLLFHTHSDQVTKILLRKGVDAKAKNKDGTTPLHVAVGRELIDSIADLIDHGANSEAGESALKSPPMHNTQGKPKLVSALVAKGANINAKDTKGNTLLHDWRAPKHYADLVILGADISIVNKQGYTPLHLACNWGQSGELPKESIEPLISKTTIDVKGGPFGQTALHLAISVQRPRVDVAPSVVSLLNKGADVTITDVNGLTPLHVAASVCQPVIAEMLIAKGASLTALDKYGRTPLAVFAILGRKRAWCTAEIEKSIKRLLVATK